MTGELYRTDAPARQEPSVLEVIQALAVDDRVSVEKLAGLMGLQERAEARNAEREFNIDLAAAMADMPSVRKDAVKDMGAKGSIPYASYEQLDRIIRPIERQHGFCRIFTTAPLDKPGTLMTCKLLHRGGHSISSTRFQPPDPGPGRNDTQAIGSADSYARRYLTLAIWNIVTIGADDDGKSAGKSPHITREQADTIESLIAELGMAPAAVSAFLEIMEAKLVSEIKADRGRQAIRLLEAKRRRAS
jgi:hypothetical protein